MGRVLTTDSNSNIRKKIDFKLKIFSMLQKTEEIREWHFITDISFSPKKLSSLCLKVN